MTHKIQSIWIDGAIRVLSIVKQRNTPVMYVLVDPDKVDFPKTSIFEVKVIGTGHQIDSGVGTPEDFGTWEFMNTFPVDVLELDADDYFMFHFFVRRRFVES